MINLKNLLKEELIGELRGFEVYKNPKSIKRMGMDLRGISFPNGDLFVVDDGGRNVIHKHFGEWLNRNGYKMPTAEVTSELMRDMKQGYITWQRIATTDEFRLGESVNFEYYSEEEYMPYIKKYLRKVKSKNPKYKFYYRNKKI